MMATQAQALPMITRRRQLHDHQCLCLPSDGVTAQAPICAATYKDSVADVKSAIRYLCAHADQYDITTSKVAVWGQSAGGYLAAMTGVTNGLKQFEDTGNPGQSSTVQAVVDQFGPSDISKVVADYDVAVQKADYATGNPFAQFVFGPGTPLSVCRTTPQRWRRTRPPTSPRPARPSSCCTEAPTNSPPQPDPDPAQRAARQGRGQHPIRGAATAT
jgi:hypothetical protein